MIQVSKAQAFMAYVDMGDQRSINGLFNQLKDQGYAIGRATLMRWKSDEEWDKRLPEVLAARELAQEAAKVVAAAEDVLEESGASIDNQLRVMAVDPDDFTPRDKLESVMGTLAGVAVKLAEVSQQGLAQLDMTALALQPAQLLLFIKAACDASLAASTVHKVLNPPAIVPKGKMIEANPAAPQREDHGPVDYDALIAAIQNPPRLQQK